MKFKLLFSICLIMASSIAVKAQDKKTQEEICYNPNALKDTTKKSIKSAVLGKIGTTDLAINYYSPGVRGRIIWGGLVPYGEVWVTGAHNATNLNINKTIIVGGKEIAPGKYALFTIPGKAEWTFIINKHWDQHLSNEYDAKDDVVRVKVKPEKNNHTERLQYFIENVRPGEGTIAVAWEKTKIRVPVKIK